MLFLNAIFLISASNSSLLTNAVNFLYWSYILRLLSLLLVLVAFFFFHIALGFSLCKTTWFTSKNCFFSQSLFFFFSFSPHLNTLTRTSNSILTSSGQNEHPDPSLRKKAFSLSPLIMMLSLVRIDFSLSGWGRFLLFLACWKLW